MISKIEADNDIDIVEKKRLSTHLHDNFMMLNKLISEIYVSTDEIGKDPPVLTQ